MKQEDINSAKSVGHPYTSGSNFTLRDSETENPSGNLSLSPPFWLDDYPQVILHRGKALLAPSKEWIKLTHQTVKKQYHQALNENNEDEAKRLIKGLIFLTRYHNALPHRPEPAPEKPIGWHLRRMLIRMDTWLSFGIKQRHANAILALAKKYGVDYEGNVYEEGW